MDFITLANSRYSCRKFSDTPVEQEKIEKILAAGLTAPTAVNKQPYKIWVLNAPDAQEKVSSATPFTFHAKLFFVVGYRTAEAWVRKFDERNFADVDASIAATLMMMEIQDLGLGTTWVGHFDAAKFQELYPSTKDYELIAIFPVGYPAPNAAPSPMHSQTKAFEELVEFL